MSRSLARAIVVSSISAMLLHGAFGHTHDIAGNDVPERGCPAACPIHSGSAEIAVPLPDVPVPVATFAIPAATVQRVIVEAPERSPASQRAPPLPC